jgi:hypothetical protein
VVADAPAGTVTVAILDSEAAAGSTDVVEATPVKLRAQGGEAVTRQVATGALVAL